MGAIDGVAKVSEKSYPALKKQAPPSIFPMARNFTRLACGHKNKSLKEFQRKAKGCRDSLMSLYLSAKTIEATAKKLVP